MEKVTVFFESKSHTEQVATFESEELYMVCLPALQQCAAQGGYIITESVETTE